MKGLIERPCSKTRFFILEGKIKFTINITTNFILIPLCSILILCIYTGRWHQHFPVLLFYLFNQILTFFLLKIPAEFSVLLSIEYSIGVETESNFNTSSSGSSSKVALKRYFFNTSSLISISTLYHLSKRLIADSRGSLSRTSNPSFHAVKECGSTFCTITLFSAGLNVNRSLGTRFLSNIFSVPLICTSPSVNKTCVNSSLG